MSKSVDYIGVCKDYIPIFLTNLNPNYGDNIGILLPYSLLTTSQVSAAPFIMQAKPMPHMQPLA